MVGGNESHGVVEGRVAENPSLQLLVGFLPGGQWNRHGYSAGFVFSEEHIGMFASGYRVCLEVVQCVVPSSVSQLLDTQVMRFSVDLHDRQQVKPHTIFSPPQLCSSIILR